MKREILFKAKSICKHSIFNKDWVYGDLVQFIDGSIYIRQRETNSHVRINPETVCQFIKDDLFENDIVERTEYKCNGEETIGKYQIVWDENELRWALKTIKSIVFRKNSILGFNGELTNVGNIHDK